MPVSARTITLNGSGATPANTVMPGVITGFILGVYVDFIATHAAGTTFALAERDKPTRTLVSNTGNTDFNRYPTVQLQDNAGTTVAQYAPYYVDGQVLTVTVASGTASAVLEVRVVYSD